MNPYQQQFYPPPGYGQSYYQQYDPQYYQQYGQQYGQQYSQPTADQPKKPSYLKCVLISSIIVMFVIFLICFTLATKWITGSWTFWFQKWFGTPDMSFQTGWDGTEYIVKAVASSFLMLIAMWISFIFIAGPAAATICYFVTGSLPLPSTITADFAEQTGMQLK